MKQVKRILASEVPEPFHSYWWGPNRLDRPEYTFYDVEGELYIGDDLELLHHWTLSGCAGIACFMLDKHIPERRDLPYVHVSGVDQFEVITPGDYETSVRIPGTTISFTVHSG